MKETINNLLAKTQTELDTCNIMVGFYELKAKGEDKEEAAKTLLKAEQVKTSLKFNTAFYEYLKSL